MQPLAVFWNLLERLTLSQEKMLVARERYGGSDRIYTAIIFSKGFFKDIMGSHFQRRYFATVRYMNNGLASYTNMMCGKLVRREQSAFGPRRRVCDEFDITQ